MLSPRRAQCRDAFRAVLLYLYVILFVTLAGCRERTLIPTMPATSQVQGPAERDRWVRVLLADNVRSSSVMLASGATLVNAATGAVITRIGQGVYTLTVSGSGIVMGGSNLSAAQVRLIPDEPFIFYLDNRSYRGELRICVSDMTGTFDLINSLPLEAYLAGVVAAEMPNYWEPQALTAQTIASRTYCLFIKERFGSRRAWDVSRTQSNQVYVGIEAESPKVWQVVNETSGYVLTCRLADGATGIFPAYFSSVCGGHTENSRKVFGDSYESLAGVSCPFCKVTARKDMFFWSTAQFDKTYVTSQLIAKYPSLARLGAITNITPTEKSVFEGYSRLTMFRLTGIAGQSEMIRAEDLRLAVDPMGRKLRSTLCQVSSAGNNFIFSSGRGFGHGVGMCQYGAQAMARKGRTYRQILAYYYPGSTITKMY